MKSQPSLHFIIAGVGENKIAVTRVCYKGLTDA